MSRLWKGLPVSEGVAVAKALVLREARLDFAHEKIDPQAVEEHLERFRQTVERTRLELEELHRRTAETLGEENAEILEAHLEVLEDPTLEEVIGGKISDELLCAPWAIQEGMREIKEMFLGLGSEYMKERAADIADVGRRLVENAAGIARVDLGSLPYACILVAKDLTPSQTMTLDFEKTLGFVTEQGGKTSHTAILSRNLGLPAVVGAAGICDELAGGELLVLDGLDGQVVAEPEQAELAGYEKKREAHRAERERLERLRDLPAVTPDGRRVELAANIGSVADAELALRYGAEGVGLYRTEFLYMESDEFPDEMRQMDAYRAAADTLKRPVLIRTLDIGGDKDLPYYRFEKEENPFLGWRAIRICLDMPEVFRAQLRGILRASAHGKLRVMFPMIISLEELWEAKRRLAECMEELRAEGIAFDEHIEVGIMVETPASVLLADLLAREVDFFSIGTNDLCQYTLAVDRGNSRIADRYNFFHPAVLRSIKQVIDASHREGKWTGMCGEFAGEAAAARLLLGMGLDEFSMTPSAIPRIKEIIRRTDYARARELAGRALQARTAAEVEALLREETE